MERTNKFLRQDASSSLRKVSVSYTWTIKNLNAIVRHSESKTNPLDLMSESKKNPLNLMSDIFPKGNCEQQPQFLLTLEEKTFTTTNNVEYQGLTINFGSQGKWKPCYGEPLGYISVRNGRYRIIDRPINKNCLKELFPNGMMFVDCKIKWLSESKEEQDTCQCNSCTPMIPATEPSNLDVDFANLFESGLFSDVKVTCSGTVFQCHKVILAARSPVFAAMFQCDMKEASQSEVEIEGIKPEVLNEMFSFIYSGNCNMKKETADLLVAADRYDLKNLKKNCEIELANGLNLKNALEMLSLTEKISAPFLEEKTNQFCQSMKSELIKDLDAKTTFSLAMQSKLDQEKKVEKKNLRHGIFSIFGNK